jgi:hypothetical protein
MVVGCGSPASEDDLLPAPDPDEGIQLAYAVDVPAGSEVWRCNVLDLPSDKWMSVNHVESVQNASMHHMDLMAIALAAPDLAPGDYDCAEVYAQYPRLMDDGIIVYASQQATQQITLPAGTVAELLPKMRVMHEIHFVNPTEAPIQAFSKINAYKYPDDQVTQQIWGGAVRDLELAIPAGATQHVEWTRCVMNKDVDVLFLSTHTHQLARRAEIRLFDGAATGELIYSNLDWHAPPLQDHTAAPLHVAAGQGFEFSCHYTNLTDKEVRWGFAAADEMCQIALVFTPGETTRTCGIVEQGVR